MKLRSHLPLSDEITAQFFTWELLRYRQTAIPLGGTPQLQTIMLQDLPWLDHSQDALVPLMAQ